MAAICAVMDSPVVGMAMVPVNDMAMFEVSPVNGQNTFNSANYPDWGANNSFNESRRRPMRNKPHHSRRSQQQPSWSPEYAAAPAPVSPPWQPQSPPAAEPASPFTGFQEPSGGPIAVNLQGLPPALCRQNFLEAMLDQAGLSDDIMGCVLGQDQDAGKAVIYLGSYNSALKCVQHFGGRRWANAGPVVTAQIAEGQASPAASAPPAPRSPTNARTGGGARKQRNSNNGQEQLNLPPAALALQGNWAMPQPMLPPSAFQMEYQKGSGEAAGGYSPKTSGSNGSNSPKTERWADLEDEEKDLSEGFEGSTSAGSTGRTTQETGESFFFGCDVDTDDGF